MIVVRYTSSHNPLNVHGQGLLSTLAGQDNISTFSIDYHDMVSANTAVEN